MQSSDLFSENQNRSYGKVSVFSIPLQNHILSNRTFIGDNGKNDCQ